MDNVDFFKNHLAQTSDSPLNLEIARAKGVFLYDNKGREYLDAISGISVSALGHQHDKTKKALVEQINKHLHIMVYGEMVQLPQLDFIKRLLKTLPPKLNTCYLVNSGSEAVEGALKLAKRYTQRSKIIYCKDAYHGSTHGALSVSGREELKRNYRPLLPNTIEIEFGNSKDLNKIDFEVATVIIETVQGEAGVRQASKSYFKKLRRKCDEVKALLILDEIQCGIGRTGTFWAFEQYDIVPDILVSAKGLGGGLPLGAFISNKKIMNSLTKDPILGHISTFGGHPLSCTSASVTIDTIYNEGLLESVEEKNTFIKDILCKEKSITEIRGEGLLLAIELNCHEKVKKVINNGLKYGLITDWFLFCNTAIRLAPPLNINKNEIQLCCERLSKCLKEIQ